MIAPSRCKSCGKFLAWASGGVLQVRPLAPLLGCGPLVGDEGLGLARGVEQPAHGMACDGANHGRSLTLAVDAMVVVPGDIGFILAHVRLEAVASQLSRVAAVSERVHHVAVAHVVLVVREEPICEIQPEGGILGRAARRRGGRGA